MTQSWVGERFLIWGSSPPKSSLLRRALSCMSATMKDSSSACKSESASASAPASKSDKEEVEDEEEQIEESAEAETKVGKLCWSCL